MRIENIKIMLTKLGYHIKLENQLPGNMITVESNYEDKIVKTISFSIKYLSIPISVQH